MAVYKCINIHPVRSSDKQLNLAEKKMSASATMNVTRDLVCLEVATSAKGQKTATLQRNGQVAYWTLARPVIPLFQPSAFVGATNEGSSSKLSLCLTAPLEVLAEAKALDQ